MSRLVSRILLSIFMFPLGVIFYTLVALVSYQMLQGANYYVSENGMFLIAGGLTWIAVALYWWMLWRGSVQWNSSRKAYTGWAAGGSIMVGFFVGAVSAAIIGHGASDFGTFFGGLVTIVMWLVATVFIWRETPLERKERIQKSGKATVACPTCGYNLTGLSESRCPECGSKFTLDELMAGQASVEMDVE